MLILGQEGLEECVDGVLRVRAELVEVVGELLEEGPVRVLAGGEEGGGHFADDLKVYLIEHILMLYHN